MIFKNLYINIIVRIVLISATCFVLPIANNRYHDIIININIIALLLIQIVLIIRRLNYMNRDLIAFFDSLKYDDSTILLTNEFQNINYLRLSRRLQVVNKQILSLKEKNAKQDQYYKTITELSNVGLLSFNEKGSIRLANKALNELLEVKDLVNIKELNFLHPNFSEILINLQPSEQKLIKISLKEKNSDRLLSLLIKSAVFKTKDENLTIVSIHDIKNELDEKELESWQKLIRILRHEIMNSIGPISSTIDTLNEIISQPDSDKTLDIKELSNERIHDIASGLKIIKERNVGLQQFVDSFRSISKLPKPSLKKIDIKPLFSDIELIWEKELEKRNVKFESLIDYSVDYIVADKSQIEQIIINLIKNSLEANCSNITIAASKDGVGKISIKVIDNGQGIQSEILDEIFLPFFTTKEQGSGIGLSLARQIMRLHGGNISVQSVPNIETAFTLTF
ncbi:MAG: ATP-binding protein [Bacteroidales bacterium]|nr:ATP-binding protein [Bacteroidales bacterium]